MRHMTTVKALIRKAHVYGDGVCGGGYLLVRLRGVER